MNRVTYLQRLHQGELLVILPLLFNFYLDVLLISSQKEAMLLYYKSYVAPRGSLGRTVLQC